MTEFNCDKILLKELKEIAKGLNIKITGLKKKELCEKIKKALATTISNQIPIKSVKNVQIPQKKPIKNVQIAKKKNSVKNVKIPQKKPQIVNQTNIPNQLLLKYVYLVFECTFYDWDDKFGRYKFIAAFKNRIDAENCLKIIKEKGGPYQNMHEVIVQHLANGALSDPLRWHNNLLVYSKSQDVYYNKIMKVSLNQILNSLK